MEHIYTGVRIAKPLHEKWQALAKELGVSRNAVISVLLEAAEVKSRPAVAIGLNGRHSVVQPVENLG